MTKYKYQVQGRRHTDTYIQPNWVTLTTCVYKKDAVYYLNLYRSRSDRYTEYRINTLA